jgi:hypothetical protein
VERRRKESSRLRETKRLCTVDDGPCEN